MDKKPYYVNVGSREISEHPYGNTASFAIRANKEEIRLLRAKMDAMQDADNVSFFRAHVPFIPYHKDSGTATYDTEMGEAFQMIHDLGGEEAKADLASMGILKDTEMQSHINISQEDDTDQK